MSQITTHVLDTTFGKPAQEVSIILEQFTLSGAWKQLGSGKTNADGRLPNLLAPGIIVEPGIYRLIFNTGSYFKERSIKGFYPEVTIAFEITDSSHYHVPLLLNPFGYSTYRGS